MSFFGASNPGLGSPGAFRPGFPGLPSPLPPPGVILTTWSASFSRNPNLYAAGPPSFAPYAVPVTNTAGNWMFAIMAWRQDAGQAGKLLFPSTVTVSDDAGNFWIPVQPGNNNAGIARCSIWMAPAARPANFVFFSPDSTSVGDAYQSALTMLVVQVQADCPWYQVQQTEFGYTNQGTALTVTQTLTTSEVFTLGVVANDVNAGTMPVTITAAGWTALPVVTTSGSTPSDHTSDMDMYSYYATTAGSPLSLSIFRNSGGAVADFAGVLISVHGVSDLLPFPYAMPLDNWPVLITETAAGPVFNADPNMQQGTAHWFGQNATVAAATWPVFTPWPRYQALIGKSVSVTPNGVAGFAQIISEKQPISVTQRYSALAYIYSVSGITSANISVQILWFTSGGGYITQAAGTLVSPVPAGSWIQLTFANGVFPPMNAATAECGVLLTSLGGVVPATDVFYVGYCGLGLADTYENAPLDDVAWADLSSSQFTQSQIAISRGIQYEQQSLEAGTMSLTLANNDASFTFGNLLSKYWPNVGDTDVQIRLRAIWPLSQTPYYVLFNGFTDDIDFLWDPQTRYGYAQVEASDAWSRLTAQMVGAAQEEILQDNPYSYTPCSLSGTNLASGNITPVQTTASQIGSGGAFATFSANSITVAGDQGTSCWQVTGSSSIGNQGFGLTYFPQASITPVSAGMTVEFWFSPVSASGAQQTTNLTVCTAFSGSGPAWTLSINNNSGAGSSTMSVTVYDKSTGAATTTGVTSSPAFLTTTNAALSWFVAVTFTQASLTVVVQPGQSNQAAVTVSCNLANTITGFSWAGNAGPIYANNLGGSGGFMNLAVYGIAIFTYIVPNARITAHFTAALSAFPGELDTSRLARIAGYAGATPIILAMRMIDIESNVLATGADLDQITAATDTQGQIASDYFTNIAASTLAFMFVNGPGSMVYRRRLESYDRISPQWAVGEFAEYPMNNNGSFQFGNTLAWLAAPNTTLKAVTLPPLSPSALFNTAGVFNGDGLSPTPNIFTANARPQTAIIPGNWYTASAVVWSPQGYDAGVNININYQNASSSSVGSSNLFVYTPLPAGSVVVVSVPAIQAPPTAVVASVQIYARGTPPSTVQFYVTDMIISQVSALTAGAFGATSGEAPYLIDTKLSSDRALMFNEAVITQAGTGTKTTYSGTSLNFTPTSGITVIISNPLSITQRASVPYTATAYLLNTAQARPYYLNEPSLEDLGNWVVQTLGQPLMRPEVVTITPAATTQSLLTALGLEVGDTVSYRRRHVNNPVIDMTTYCSKLSHDIDIANGRWDTKLELSPFPQGTVLKCDDAIHGTLTGGNYFGW